LPLTLLLGGLASAQTVVFALPPAQNISYFFPITPSRVYTSVNIHYAQAILYKPLITVNAEHVVSYRRSIARSITTQDGRTYLIELNPKWHWSDGTPVTAEDLAFDLELLTSITPQQAALFGAYGGGGIPQEIDKVEVLGPYRLRLVLKHRVSPTWFILNGLGLLTPLPKQAWDRYPGDPAKTLAYLEARGGDPSFIEASPVDGPFQLAQAIRNQQFVFTANPHYDGHRPAYRELIMRYFTTTDAEFNALRAGEVQVGYLPIHLLADREIPGYRFISQAPWAFYFLFINYNRPGTPLKSLAVRQALEMAIDQPGIVSKLFHGQGVEAYGPVPYVPPTYLSPYLKAEVPYPYDPAQGRKLLEAHGWKLVDGVFQKGAQRLSFRLIYPIGSVVSQQEVELIVEAAAQEGIQISLSGEPIGTLLGQIGSPQGPDLAGPVFWTYGNDPYPSNYTLFHSGNRYGYRSAQMDIDTPLTHAYLGGSATSLRALYRYEDFAARDLPLLFLPEENSLFEVAQNLKGLSGHLYIAQFAPQYWHY
jgi:peptide/nickel transport system substrate-binding protein